MNNFQKEFEAFMTTLEGHCKDLPFSFSEYPIDHACYRMNTPEDYEQLCKAFQEISMVVINAPHHERKFHSFVLRKPLTYKNTKVDCVEVSEPGGSDDYTTGFQHIEFHTTQDLKKIASSIPSLASYIFAGKFGDEVYLKWPDKLALKFTDTPLVVKSMSKPSAEIIKRA